MSLAYFIAIPLLAIFLTPLWKNNLRVVSVIVNIALLYVAFSFSSQLPIKEFIGFDSPLAITFVLNSVSLFFVSLFIFISLLFSIYNIKEENNKAHFILLNSLLVGVFGLVLSYDIFNIYIFFEIVSISGYILTSLNKDKKAYSGAIKYMIIGTIASVFILLAIMLIYLQIGSLNIGVISEQFNTIDEKVQFLILLSLFIGFGIKAEIFPLNFWVADIYQATNTKITSLFSSIVSKSFIFVFFNIVYILDIHSSYLYFFSIVGIVSFLIAELSAYGSKDIQRVFAYSTLGQLGVVFLAFSYIHITILSGAIMLIFLHSLTKLMLFLSLDILKQKFKSTKIDIFKKFNSLFLTIIFSVGFLSLLGIPPFGGFIAKLTILSGLSTIGEFVMVGLILLISLIEAIYLFRIISNIKVDNTIVKEKIEIPFLQKVILSFLAILIFYFGIYPDVMLEYSQIIASCMLELKNV
ncbi:MAG: proton-conducting transporter membrane subunit [Campylobacterota bacterium]|nr:proton-conducting transporter membrane subunit [Campylobacterota bacterium]